MKILPTQRIGETRGTGRGGEGGGIRKDEILFYECAAIKKAVNCQMNTSTDHIKEYFVKLKRIIFTATISHHPSKILNSKIGNV